MLFDQLAYRKTIGFVQAASLALVAAGGALLATPAHAAGDLLVAPTRVVLDGRRGTEVILNNIGDEETTYRISLELRRMMPDGSLEDVAVEDANETEKASLSLIRYAPRRVTLPPDQPQSIRIGLNQVEGLKDGEYRVHMLFRAIPKAPTLVTDPASNNEIKIQLTPLYGITIPVIIRRGDLKATAAIANPRIVDAPGGKALEFDAVRQGNRSVYGDVRVRKDGKGEPLFEAKGIAIYPEIGQRKVSLPLKPEDIAELRGAVTVGYYETLENGGGLIGEVRTVLP
jgi:P pilus assembly chaperone PapD